MTTYLILCTVCILSYFAFLAWNVTRSARQEALNARYAEGFADRPGHREPGRVWTATVEPGRLLARIVTHRSESEYVVDTDGLEIVAARDLT